MKKNKIYQCHLATLPSHAVQAMCLDSGWDSIMQKQTKNPEPLSEPNYLISMVN